MQSVAKVPISSFKWHYKHAKCHLNGAKMAIFSKKIQKSPSDPIHSRHTNLGLGSSTPTTPAQLHRAEVQRKLVDIADW